METQSLIQKAMMIMMTYRTAGLLFIAGVLLSACKTAPAPLYQWSDYQPMLYQHFNGASPEEQITTLEADLEKIKANGNLAPPGLHAHLGMLYASTGKYDQGAQELLMEKRLFPDSAAYMDFLLNKTKTQE